MIFGCSRRGFADAMSVLWIGSAALVEAIANDMPAAAVDARGVRDVVSGPVLFVVGSASDMAQRQIAAFASAGGNHVELIDALELLAMHAAGDDASWHGNTIVARAVARASAAAGYGIDTLVAVAGEPHHVVAALAHGAARGWDARETSRRIHEALVAAAGRIVDASGCRAVVLSGGDVARSFCDARGIRALNLIAEVAPGVQLSRAVGANLLLVTKPGGFGHAETYHDIVSTLRMKAPT